MDLAEQVFATTEPLPRKEDYGLTSQIRRSALSVSANIAEGFGRHHTKDKLNFYYASRGSLAETKSHLIYGFKVHYFNSAEFTRLAQLVENIWEELSVRLSLGSNRESCNHQFARDGDTQTDTQISSESSSYPIICPSKSLDSGDFQQSRSRPGRLLEDCEDR